MELHILPPCRTPGPKCIEAMQQEEATFAGLVARDAIGLPPEEKRKLVYVELQQLLKNLCEDYNVPFSSWCRDMALFMPRNEYCFFLKVSLSNYISLFCYYCCSQRGKKPTMAANNGDSGIRIVDFRSDTVTKPSAQMRQAMAAAEVGDDVLREDTTVLELERRCAEMMGKESSLFTPSGTMSNLISVMNHCQERGVEVIIGKDSHINRYEQGGMAQIAGVYPKVLKNLPDGTLDLSQLLDNICLAADVHYSQTRLICIENTHNYCGGRVLTLEYMKRVYEAAQLQGIKVHLDGARLLNASLALNVPPAEITQYCDSVSMCFSKGIGAPVGSILAGTQSFITRALRLRKVLGGGMRQVGVLAAAALVGLDEAPSKMAKDHKHARMIAEALHKNGHGIVSVDPSVVQSNIIMVDVVKDNLTSKDLCHRMFQTTPEEVRILGKKITVKISPRDSHTLRMVTNCDVSEDDIKNTIEKFGYVLKELAS